MTAAQDKKADEWDGFIAWNPNDKNHWNIQAMMRTLSTCPEWCLRNWKEKFANHYQSGNQLKISQEMYGDTYRFAEEAWALAQEDKWRIRPVKLVFLDEEK